MAVQVEQRCCNSASANHFLLLIHHFRVLFVFITMSTQPYLPFCYPGQLTQYVRPNGSIVAERFVPSLITNIPPTEQRADVLGLLYPWMRGVADEHNPVVRDSFSFLRMVWYLPAGLPRDALPGKSIRVPGLGSFTMTGQFVDDFQYFIRWTRVCVIWLETTREPIRYGAIGVPMCWHHLPESHRPQLSWSIHARGYIHRLFPSFPRPFIVVQVPSTLELVQDEPRVGPGLLSGQGVDPYYLSMGALGYEDLAPFKIVVEHLEYGLPGGKYLVEERHKVRG
jgi:hypothetical protein